MSLQELDFSAVRLTPLSYTCNRNLPSHFTDLVGEGAEEIWSTEDPS
jgi:hypothetical protein